MDQEQVIEKLWENAGHGTRREDIEASYAAGVAAERARWEDSTSMDCASCEYVAPTRHEQCKGCERTVTIHTNYKRASWA